MIKEFITKIKNKRKAKEFLVQMMTEINTQDNRVTTSPFYYTIRTKKWMESYYKDEGDRVVFVNNKHPDVKIISFNWNEAIKDLKKMLLEEDNIKINNDAAEDILSNEYTEYWEMAEWEEQGCFFTESEAELHLKLNNHHYSKDAHTYVNHFWRAPNVEKFFKSIAILCDVKDRVN